MISKASFIGQYIEDINNSYVFIQELGSGAFGSVWKLQNKLTNETFACKKLNKRKIKNKERFVTEMTLLKATDHPNIVKLFEIYEDAIYVYLIMEICHGGDFLDRLSVRANSNTPYSEREAAKVFKSLMSAINYCHTHGISHRDIKPENILFGNVEEDSLKVIDFGLSKIFSSNKLMNSIVGTVYYMAPEVVNGKYDHKCDVWSAGVILYMMLSGRLPFTGLNDLETIKKIVKLEYTFDFDEWNKISQPAKNLIKRIFVNDEERLTSQEVLNSEWVTQLGPDGDAELLSIHIVDVNLYTRLNKIHKFVINYICFRLKEEGTKELIKIFKSIDKNSDGVITLSEFKESISKVCFKNAIDIEENFIHNLYIEIDIDKNGLINYNEFISSLLNYKSMKNPERLYESFRTLDLEKNGRLTLSSVLSAIRPQTREDVETIEKCFKKYDLNKDGFIDFEEFIKALELGELENLEQYKALLY